MPVVLHFVQKLEVIPQEKKKSCRTIVLTPTSNFNSPYCQQYNSYNVSSENLLLDQLIIPKSIFIFILITYLVDIVLILSGKFSLGHPGS